MRVSVLLIGSMLLLASCGGGGSDAEDSPAPTVAAVSQTPIPTATPAGCTPLVYTVQDGDTLSGIAAAHDLDLQAIIDANELGNPNSLSIGQLIEIPCPDATATP